MVFCFRCTPCAAYFVKPSWASMIVHLMLLLQVLSLLTLVQKCADVTYDRDAAHRVHYPRLWYSAVDETGTSMAKG